jgi:hypothetical protein
VGDKRTRVFLALLPRMLDDGKTMVWLERVRVDETLDYDYEGGWWWRVDSCQLAEGR